MNTERVTVDVGHMSEGLGLPDDYMQYHYTFHKGLVGMLRPDLRRGIDVIFLYRQDNIRSFCKKIDRFWHNFRKTVDKRTYYEVRCRTVQQVIHNYEDSLVMIEWFEDARKNPLRPQWDFPVSKGILND
jgi:hypothetical protein